MKTEVKLKWGSELCFEDQREALNLYVHRHTGNHKPDWAQGEWRDGQPYPVQFKDDNEWLAHTQFRVNSMGRLHYGYAACESHPTWPDNPELRREAVAI